MMKGKREKYIDGMKGYACLFILLGHFMGIYKYAENADMIDSWFVRILTIGPLSFFSAESYWLYLFLVISGYLLMTFNIPNNYKEFVIKCAKRALRFVIPVIGTAIYIYIYCKESLAFTILTFRVLYRINGLLICTKIH